MNVEIGTDAEQFPEKEYINGIFVAVHWHFPMIWYKHEIFSFSDFTQTKKTKGHDIYEKTYLACPRYTKL